MYQIPIQQACSILYTQLYSTINYQSKGYPSKVRGPILVAWLPLPNVVSSYRLNTGIPVLARPNTEILVLEKHSGIAIPTSMSL